MTLEDIRTRFNKGKDMPIDSGKTSLQVIKEIRLLKNEMAQLERTDAWYQLAEEIATFEDNFFSDVPFG